MSEQIVIDKVKYQSILNRLDSLELKIDDIEELRKEVKLIKSELLTQEQYIELRNTVNMINDSVMSMNNKLTNTWVTDVVRSQKFFETKLGSFIMATSISICSVALFIILLFLASILSPDFLAVVDEHAGSILGGGSLLVIVMNVVGNRLITKK